MKLSLVVCVTLVGAASALSLNKALQPMRFAENRPEATQDWSRGEDQREEAEHGWHSEGRIGRGGAERSSDKKLTPGKSCWDFENCHECAEMTPCIWIPHDPHDTTNKGVIGHCTEERAQGDDEVNSALGERRYECDVPHEFEVVDTPDDELDDYSDLHINGSPTNTDIAVLNKAEPMYTVADELGVGEGPEAEAGGDWLEGGNTHEEYEGHISQDQITKIHNHFTDKLAAEEAEEAAAEDRRR